MILHARTRTVAVCCVACEHGTVTRKGIRAGSCSRGHLTKMRHAVYCCPTGRRGITTQAGTDRTFPAVFLRPPSPHAIPLLSLLCSLGCHWAVCHNSQRQKNPRHARLLLAFDKTSTCFTNLNSKRNTCKCLCILGAGTEAGAGDVNKQNRAYNRNSAGTYPRHLKRHYSWLEGKVAHGHDQTNARREY